jgi:hypothetical protein
MGHPKPKLKRRKAATRLVTVTATFKAPEDLDCVRLTALLNRLIANGIEAADPNLEGNENDPDCRDISRLPRITLHAGPVPQEIFVELAGGVVQNVYATTRHLDVHVADHGNAGESDSSATFILNLLNTRRRKLRHVY